MEIVIALFLFAITVAAGWYFTAHKKESVAPEETLSALPSLSKVTGKIVSYKKTEGSGTVAFGGGETMQFALSQWRDLESLPTIDADVDVYDLDGERVLYTSGNTPENIAQGLSIVQTIESIIERFVKEGCTNITRTAYTVVIACTHAPVSYTVMYRGGEVVVTDVNNNIVEINHPGDTHKSKEEDFYLRLWD